MKNQSSLPALLTACALFALVPLASAATYIWNQATVGANNWNDNANWNPSTGNPGSADGAVFGVVGTSTSATTVNNVVSVNTTITALSYTNIGSSVFHVTQIPADVTLTVSSSFTNGGWGAVGSPTTLVSMTGAGTFQVTGNTFHIGNNAASGTGSATLDLSGLTNFVYNASGGTFNMGNEGSRSVGNINLAAGSNYITAGTINANVGGTSTATTGTINLGGGTNIINANTINVAAGRNTTTIQFSGVTGGLRLRGTGGTDTDRATIVLGNRNVGGTSSLLTTGNILANGHPVDMKLATLTMGTLTRNGTEAGFVATGVCQFDQGTVDATTINMAVYPGTSPSSSAIGILTVGANGALIIGTGGLSLANIGGSAGAGAIATGTLNIFGGTATCAGSITKASTNGTGTISITNGTLNMVSGTIGTPAVPIDNLNLTNATLQLSVANGTTNIAATTFNLVNGGANTLNIAALPSITNYSTAIFPIIRYTTFPGSGTLALGTLPSTYTGYISNDTVSTIWLVVTNGPAVSKPVTWDGTIDGNWDTTTANWKTNAPDPSTTYSQNDFALFDDTATGPTTINLTTTITPGSLTINNSTLNYTFSGGGSLGGGSGLTKNGSGTLILDNSGINNFGGGVTISGGTLQFGNNDANGNLPATGSVTDNGSLVFNRSDSFTVANVISGSGTLTNNGNGTLTLSAANSFAGGLTVNAGTVRPTNVRAPGTGTLTVNSGGTLVLINGITNAITLAGGTLGAANSFTGTNTLRAAASTTSVVQTADPQNPTSSLNIQIDGVLLGSGNILVINATNVSSADGGNGFRLRGTNLVSDFSGTITLSNNVKGELLTSTNGTFSPAGTGKFKLVCGAFNGDGTQNGPVTGGYSEFNLRNNSVGNAVLGNDVEVIGSGTTILDPIGSAPVGATVTMGNLKVGGGQEVGVYLASVPNHVVVFPTVTLTGGNAKFSPKTPGFGSLTSVGSDLSLGDISEQTAGSGIIMAGWRTLTLTGNNTYSGNTIVSSGTLALSGAASIASSPSIIIASGAILNGSGLSSTFALGASQTLSNSTSTATINGSANTGSGTVSLTYASGTPSLNITNGTLTLSASTVFKVNNTGAALAAGSYKIISKATSGTVGLVAGTAPSSVTVGGNGTAGAASLQISGGELYLLVDNAPVVANIVTNYVTSGLTWKIAITDLKTAAGWSDPDGDPVTLSSVTSPSANGATVTKDSTHVYYNAGVTNEDSFTYTVTDGTLTANGTVYLEVAPPSTNQTHNIIGETVNGDGSITIKFAGIPNYTYWVEATTNLVAPVWIPISTNVAGTNGLWQFTDTDATNYTQRFYRSHKP